MRVSRLICCITVLLSGLFVQCQKQPATQNANRSNLDSAQKKIEALQPSPASDTIKHNFEVNQTKNSGQQTVDTTTNLTIRTDSLGIEMLDDFIKKFFADSVFQFERVHWPFIFVGSWTDPPSRSSEIIAGKGFWVWEQYPPLPNSTIFSKVLKDSSFLDCQSNEGKEGIVFGFRLVGNMWYCVSKEQRDFE
jgi:hypothetical protein